MFNLMIFLLPMFDEAAEQGVTPVGRTHHERRRAAAVFAMKRMNIGIPANVLSLITSESHQTHQGMETGFYPWNEWKSLKLVFHRNHRTASLFQILNKYDDAMSALVAKDKACESWYSLGLILDEKGKIIMVGFYGIADGDFRDLSRLPADLMELEIHKRSASASLTQLPPGFFSQLPRRLIDIDLCDNALSDVVVESVPPTLRCLVLTRNAGNVKVRFRRPLPMYLAVHVDSIDNVDPGDGELVKDDRRYCPLKWSDGTQIGIIPE